VRPVRWFRAAAQTLVLFPLIRVGYGVEVTGKEHLDGVRRPCMLISNHNMHLDWSMVLRTLPRRIRQRTAVAAAASDIFSTRKRSFTSKLFGNAYPFDKTGSGVRESLEFTKGLLDGGWNVLIFPEGQMSETGAMGPFKSGVAWIASRANADVLPMRVEIVRPGIYEGARFPRRGRVRVHIGAPVRLARDASYGETTRVLEAAVREA
jgi:1-acyl-sn-glycerol-3-phosphate acyltransferase